MKRLQLTEEEARHIEQRRDNEKRYALGYNQALIDVNAWLDDQTQDSAILTTISVSYLRDQMNTLRKQVK